MRQLTSKQKKLLRKWFNESKGARGICVNGNYGIVDYALTVSNLTVEQWETLVEINDTEILWQEVNRFLWDLKFKK